MTLAERYDHLCKTPSSIDEHLPVLRHYAYKCQRVAEFGVDIGQSTTAFLMAQPEVLYSVDLVEHPDLHQLLDIGVCERLYSNPRMYTVGRTMWLFKIGDSRTIDLPVVDLLFIDSAHSYEQLHIELTRHHSQVRQWIILHDTVTFGPIGEAGPPQLGLTPAIDAFMALHPEWRERETLLNNNGLMVLERTHAN